MSDISRAFDAFTSHMASIGWVALALAVVCHLAKGAVRARAWRNVLAAAYPDVPIRWRSAFGAYAAGVGLNSILPARIGDLVRLYLMRRRIPGASYPTLASSLLVEAIFDTLVSALLVAWAIEGLFPGLDVLPRLPSIDWLWAFHHPRAATTIVAVALAAGIALFAWAARHIEAFGRRLAQGVTILRTPREYARRVLAWQLVEWPLRLATLGLFLHAFDMPATVRNTLLTQATQSVATALPLTPAGIGTEQALLVYIFLGSAPSSVVLSFSVGMKVVLIVVNLVVGLAALALMTRTSAFAAPSGPRPATGIPRRCPPPPSHPARHRRTCRRPDPDPPARRYRSLESQRPPAGQPAHSCGRAGVRRMGAGGRGPLGTCGTADSHRGKMRSRGNPLSTARPFERRILWTRGSG